MARASPHTAAPKSKDYPCAQEAVEALNQPTPKPSRSRSPQQKLAWTTRNNQKPPRTSPTPVAKRTVCRLFEFTVVNLNLPWWILNLLWWIWICRGEFEFAAVNLNLPRWIWICCGEFQICCHEFKFAVTVVGHSTCRTWKCQRNWKWALKPRERLENSESQGKVRDFLEYRVTCQVYQILNSFLGC